MLVRIAVATILAACALQARAEDLSAAQRAIFNTPHLANITEPVTLRYTYKHQGTLEQAFDDIVDVTITKVMPDGGRDVSFNFLSDKHHQDFPVIEGFHSNPVIMMFLEHDVAGLSSQTGGSTLYFRNRIRDAFVDRATAEEVTVPLRRQGGAGNARNAAALPAGPHARTLREVRGKDLRVLSGARCAGGCLQHPGTDARRLGGQAA